MVQPSNPPLWTAHDFLAHRYGKNPVPRLPLQVVMGFFPALPQKILAQGSAVRHTPLSDAFPMLHITKPEHEMGFIYPGMGAPLAASCLELAIAMGARQVLFIGWAGALSPSLRRGELVVVEEAWSDEGTSAHYGHQNEAPLSGKSRLTGHLIHRLEERGLPYQRGRTWTTDGLFRETLDRCHRFMDKGCNVVDMEASALFAVARYHGISIAGLFMVADSLAHGTWTARPQAIRHGR